jgi:hypothetical protein
MMVEWSRETGWRGSGAGWSQGRAIHRLDKARERERERERERQRDRQRERERETVCGMHAKRLEHLLLPRLVRLV